MFGRATIIQIHAHRDTNVYSSQVLRTRLIELLLSESPNGTKALVLEFLLILITVVNSHECN